MDCRSLELRDKSDGAKGNLLPDDVDEGRCPSPSLGAGSGVPVRRCGAPVHHHSMGACWRKLLLCASGQPPLSRSLCRAMAARHDSDAARSDENRRRRARQVEPRWELHVTRSEARPVGLSSTAAWRRAGALQHHAATLVTPSPYTPTATLASPHVPRSLNPPLLASPAC